MTRAPAAAAPRPGQGLVPLPCEVASIQRETRDCWTLTLMPPHGAPTPAFAPGQFNMLYAFGVGEVPISMSGDPGDVSSWVHTVRAVGAVSRALCTVKRGAAVGVRGPYGTPWPVEQAEGRDVVLVAGGIGLAPLRPVLYSLLRHRERYGRLILLYGARTPEDLLFPRQLAAWRGRFDMHVDVTVDHARSEWMGHVGVVTQLFRGARFDADDTVAMICGPEIMMRYSAAELRQRGVPSDRIFVSMERNMHCAVGSCGHCQLGPAFVCMDGPVFSLDRVDPLLHRREL